MEVPCGRNDIMKILLISPFLAPDRKPTVYNIGLGYIAASLIEAGHDVSVLDIEGHRYSKPEVTKKIKEADCEVIGIGTIITGYSYVKWLIKTIRKVRPDVKLWVGNSIATTIPDLIMKDMDIDVVVKGEGEVTVKELAKVTEAGGDLENVNGIVLMKDGKPFHTQDRELIQDLDTIPFPAWHLFPQAVYSNNVSVKSIDLPHPTMYISTARGCPYHCTYCYHPFQNRKVRFHSAKRIVEEIKKVQEDFGIKSIIFADDLFITNRKRVHEFCDLVEKEGLKFSWIAAGRVNLVEEELLEHMKQAGCACLSFGIESGSQKILKNIKKQTTVEQGEKAIAMCKKVGILPLCSFMIGNVGETRATMRESVDFIKRNIDDTVSFFFTTPYPDTELYQYAMDHGMIKDEIKLFEAYGEQGSKILVNFTDMSDQELIDLRAEAEREIQRHYYKRHPLKLAKALGGRIGRSFKG